MCVDDRGSGEVSDDGIFVVRWADNKFLFWNALANTKANTSVEALAT